MIPGTERTDIDHLPHLLVNHDYLPLLKSADLLDFERLYHHGGKLKKRIRERSVYRITLGSDAGEVPCYLKRHEAARPCLSALLGRCLFGRRISPGMAEFENILEFKRAGIPTVIPVAAGERRLGFLRYESFLLTRDTAPYESLESIIRSHPERLTGGPENQRYKHRLIHAVGRLARKMHDRGFNHRDFNATHVLVGPERPSGKIPLALFDLQRMDRKKWLRLKWRIKTMAEMFYTMEAPVFDETDRRMLFQAYRGTPATRRWDRLQLFWILRKTIRIAKHTRKIMARKAPDPSAAREGGDTERPGTS
jgi:lipopolysaccharide core heptose(I) kinase